jgi:hypothetical protein
VANPFQCEALSGFEDAQAVAWTVASGSQTGEARNDTPSFLVAGGLGSQGDAPRAVKGDAQPGCQREEASQD